MELDQIPKRPCPEGCGTALGVSKGTNDNPQEWKCPACGYTTDTDPSDK